jgi:hypothetical protein
VGRIEGERMPKRTIYERVDAVLRRKKGRFPRCWPRVVRSYMAKDERENLRMLFQKFGVKYWLEKKRLRVVYKIPWGVEFDVRNPGACPLAGTWDGFLECFKEVWGKSTQEEKKDFVETMIEKTNPRRN